MKLPVHVCLVSEDATPNLTPALDKAFQPEEIILFSSKEMTNHATWLSQALARYQIKTSVRLVEDAWQHHLIKSEIMALLEERAGETVVLNLSGGNKIMAVAAHEAFHTAGHPIFYVHTEKDEVIWVHEDRDPYRLQTRVNLPAYLLAYGYQLAEKPVRTPPSHEMQLLTAYLVDNVVRFGNALASLNYYASSAEMTLRSKEVSLEVRQHPDFNELLDRFENLGLLLLDVSGCMVFQNEEARFFANGGWLEQHVFAAVSSLRSAGKIQDAAIGVEIIAPHGSKNEIDVMFLADNRLYLVECKTRRFLNDHPGNPSGAETLYKLDALTELGGLRARGILVTYQPLPKWDLQRAKDLNIQLVEGQEIQRIGKSLESITR
jgi:hypothetical protein